MTTDRLLNIVVAHTLEAKPLIAMLGLKKQNHQSPFALYRNDKGTSLIIAGIGKLAAAAATGYLAALQDSSETAVKAWLNLGIAGHQTAELGSGLLAQKLTDQATGSCFYPPMLLTGFATSDVITVDEPELEYPVDAAYEMEAFGFYAVASRLVTSELVQVFKIVSDNPSNPVKDIDAKLIQHWIKAQRAEIEKLILDLDELAQEYNAAYQLPAEFNELSAMTKLSVTQQNQLKRLCRRYYALGQEAQLRAVVEKPVSSAKGLIIDLEIGLINVS